MPDKVLVDLGCIALAATIILIRRGIDRYKARHPKEKVR